MKHSDASEARQIAKELIPEFHSHLNGITIDYVFIDEVPKSKGKEVLGRAKKVTGLNAYLAQRTAPSPHAMDDEFFVIELSRPKWLILTEAQKRALVDHELCHCQIEYDEDSNIKLKIISHDVEEFTDVIARHGLWENDVRRMSHVISEQLKLEMDDPNRVTSITISTVGDDGKEEHLATTTPEKLAAIADGIRRNSTSSEVRH